MQVSGICVMCGGIAMPATTCDTCGAIVCMKCFDSDLGICKRCSAMMSR
jgi:hypothetical protein